MQKQPMFDYYNINIMSVDKNTLSYEYEYNARFDAIIQLIAMLTLPRQTKMAAAIPL